jgi:hypothetical protein
MTHDKILEVHTLMISLAWHANAMKDLILEARGQVAKSIRSAQLAHAMTLEARLRAAESRVDLLTLNLGDDMRKVLADSSAAATNTRETLEISRDQIIDRCSAEVNRAKAYYKATQALLNAGVRVRAWACDCESKVTEFGLPERAAFNSSLARLIEAEAMAAGSLQGMMNDLKELPTRGDTPGNQFDLMILHDKAIAKLHDSVREAIALPV